MTYLLVKSVHNINWMCATVFCLKSS